MEKFWYQGNEVLDLLRWTPEELFMRGDMVCMHMRIKLRGFIRIDILYFIDIKLQQNYIINLT